MLIAGARSPERLRENAVTVMLDDSDLEVMSDMFGSFPMQGFRSILQMAERNEY